MDSELAWASAAVSTLRVMEGNVELLRESFREGEVGICFVAAQTVVQMGGVQHQAQFPAPLGESAKEGDGICAAGKTDGETHAGAQQGRVERK